MSRGADKGQDQIQGHRRPGDWSRPPPGGGRIGRYNTTGVLTIFGRTGRLILSKPRRLRREDWLFANDRWRALRSPAWRSMETGSGIAN